jgi:hypothetical protein
MSNIYKSPSHDNAIREMMGSMTGVSDGSMASARGVADHQMRKALLAGPDGVGVSTGRSSSGPGPWFPWFDRWMDATRRLWLVLAVVGAAIGYSTAASGDVLWPSIAGAAIGWLLIPLSLIVVELAYRVLIIAAFGAIAYAIYRLIA